MASLTVLLGIHGFILFTNQVSVIVGNQNYKGNHLVEQIMPTDRLGKNYALILMQPTTASGQTGWTTVYRLQATVSGKAVHTNMVYQTGRNFVFLLEQKKFVLEHGFRGRAQIVLA